jgi:hypothetical protein
VPRPAELVPNQALFQIAGDFLAAMDLVEDIPFETSKRAPGGVRGIALSG